MAGVRIALLLVLVGTRLLVSGQEWEHIDETQRWDKLHGVTSLDDHSDTGDDAVPEKGAATSDDLGPSADHGFQMDPVNAGRHWASIANSGFQMEFDDVTDGPAPSNWESSPDSGSEMEFDDPSPPNSASDTDSGFEMEFDDPTPPNWASSTDSGFEMEFDDPALPNWASSEDGGSHMDFDRAWTRGISQRSSGQLEPWCGKKCSVPQEQKIRHVELEPHVLHVLQEPQVLQEPHVLHVLQEPQVLQEPHVLHVLQEPQLLQEPHVLNVLQEPHVLQETQVLQEPHVLHVLQEPQLLQEPHVLNVLQEPHVLQETQVLQEPHVLNVLQELQVLQEPHLLQEPQTLPLKPSKAHSECKPHTAKGCAVSAEERVACGYVGIASVDCKKMGCCVDPSTSACFYPLDECTMDQHFVFAIRYNCASIPVDPRKLIIPGTNCRPLFANNKVAIFKFKVTECGTRSYQVGNTRIYLAEVQTVVKALNLKYGIITRSHPLRFLVECRYNQMGAAPQSALATVGFLVKTPSSSLPSSVIGSGSYGVYLRIARDQTYSSYFPTYHQPLRLLLGRPVYLELILPSRNPGPVILVNYCIAYPRSASNALVLIYEGCANPNDPGVQLLKTGNLHQKPNQRRFVVSAFEFMSQKTNKYLNEEIYFMCSTEVCWPSEKMCQDRCFR